MISDDGRNKRCWLKPPDDRLRRNGILPDVDEQAAMARFKRERELAQAPIRLGIERRVFGCDYGATSWTTIREARQVAGLLRLGPGKRLLEVGAGSGWPGLYFAATTGCDVVLTDIPFYGLRSAAARARADALSGARGVVAADGAALPFASAAFDAVSHSDVLCCLRPKRAALASCRRVARAGARTAFTVISIPPGLSLADHERAVAAAPSFAESKESYPAMLEMTGWKITDHVDLTGEFIESSRRMQEEEKVHAVELGNLYGETEFAARLTRRRSRVGLLEQGLLRRDLFAASAAPITGE